MTQSELEKLAEALGGMSILGALEGSPAEAAGLRYGDVLLEVNGQPTPGLSAFIEATRVRLNPMSLRVFRNGAEHRFELALTEKPTPMNAAQLLGSVARSGLLKPAAQRELEAELLAERQGSYLS